MTLPKWVEELKNQRDSAISHDEIPDCSLVIKALAVAMEALGPISRNGCCDTCQEAKRWALKALAEIEKMGDK